jgi:ketosteroid isomerase-like protein
MGESDNKALIEKWRLAVNGRDLEGVVMSYAPDAHVWSPRLELVFGPDGIVGRDMIRVQQQVFFDTWPDGAVTRREMFADGDRVVLLGTMGGTHTIPYTVPGGGTYPPTGNLAHAELAAVFTVRDGLIAENLEYYDYLSLVGKVGVKWP